MRTKVIEQYIYFVIFWAKIQITVRPHPRSLTRPSSLLLPLFPYCMSTNNTQTPSIVFVVATDRAQRAISINLVPMILN